MNDKQNSYINKNIKGIENHQIKNLPELNFTSGSLLENNLLKEISSLGEFLKFEIEHEKNDDSSIKKKNFINKIWTLLREILNKKGNICYVVNLTVFWSEIAFFTNFIDFFECIYQLDESKEEYNNSLFYEQLEQEPIEKAMTKLILLAYNSIFSFGDFNLGFFYLHMIIEIENSETSGKNNLSKSLKESRIQQVIFNINILSCIRVIIIEDKSEKEEQELILKHLDILMNLKDKHNLYYFEELKNLPLQQFKTLLYLIIKKTTQLIKFRILLTSTRNFIDYHEYLESHLNYIKNRLNKFNICDECFQDIYLDTFNLKEINLLLELEKLTQDGVNSDSFCFNDYANSSNCEILLDHIFPNEPNQKLLINILEGIPCDRSEVKLFEYHNQIFQKLKFLNRFTFDSCNQRLIMNSYHMNDKPEANQNQFKIQEDKFFFSFLNQVIYPELISKTKKILAKIQEEVKRKNSYLNDFQVFSDEEPLNKDLKHLIQLLISYLRAIIMNTVLYRAYIFWENKEYLQYFFSNLNDLFILVAKVHPIFVIIFSDFLKKFYFLLIRRIDITNIFYKTLTQQKSSQKIVNNINNISEFNYKKFNIDIRIIMINYLESFLHFLIYAKRLYYSYVNVSLLKYFNFIYEIIFSKEEDLFYFANKNPYVNNKINFEQNKKPKLECNINKIIFKFMLQIGCCLDIDKISFYCLTNEETNQKLKIQNNLLEKLQEDLNMLEVNQIESFYRSLDINPSNCESQIDAIILYLKNFKIRKYDEKTNILELLVLIHKTFKGKFSNLNLNKKVEKVLFDIEIQNNLFSKINKFFEVEENLNQTNIPIRYEKKLESLEKNAFQLKTILNIPSNKQKMPSVYDYKNLNENSFLEETIQKMLSKQDCFFSFNLRFNDIVKYFICNLYEIILKKLKEDKSKILNVKKYKSTKIKDFLDLLNYENYDLSNFDALNELAPESSDGQRISFKGAVNFLKISTLFSREIKREKLLTMGYDVYDPENNKLLYNQDIDITKLFDNIAMKNEITKNSPIENFIFLLNLRFIREVSLNLSTAEADSEFFTRVALFAIKENVLNFSNGAVSLENMDYIKNLNKESFFSLKLRYLIIKLIPQIIRENVRIQSLEPISNNNYDIGCLERNYNFLNTTKFNISNAKLLKGLNANEKNNYLSYFYIIFEENFQDTQFFIELLSNQLYFECINLLESKLGKIKDAEASLSNLDRTSYAYDRRQTMLIKIYIYCYIKIEFLETGKILNLNLESSNVIENDIKSFTFDTNEADVTEDLFYHFKDYLDDFNYETNGNLSTLYKLFSKCKENFQKILDEKQEILEQQNSLINFKSSLINDNDTKNQSENKNANLDKQNIYLNDSVYKISVGNFTFFLSEAVYHFSSLLCYIRSLYCSIESYKNLKEKNSKSNKMNIHSDFASIAELEIENDNNNYNYNRNLCENEFELKNLNIENCIDKHFEEIQESVLNIIKYSEYFEKFIFSAFYLNKNLKKKISRTDSVYEFEEKIFSIIPEEQNIFSLSLNENLFYKFNLVSNLLKEFIEEKFITFIFSEMSEKNMESEASAINMVNFTRFCHSQKFEINNSAKNELNLSTQKLKSKKLNNLSLNNNHQTHNGNKENLLSYKKRLHNLESNQSKANIILEKNENEKIVFKRNSITNKQFNEKIENENNNFNNKLNNTYSYNRTSLNSFDLDKVYKTTHEKDYLKNLNLQDLDSKIQDIFIDFILKQSTEKSNLQNNKSLNSDDYILSQQKLDKHNIPNLNNKFDLGENKFEDVFSLRINRCIMNVTNNLDMEIKISIAIIKNYIEERKNYKLILNHAKKLFGLFLKKYLAIEELPQNNYEYSLILDTKKSQFEEFISNNNKEQAKPAKAKKGANSINLQSNQKNKNDLIDAKYKIINSEVYLEILEIFKVIFSNYDDLKDTSFFKRYIIGVYDELGKFFDDSVSHNKIRFRIIEINIRLNNYRDIDKYRAQLIKIMNNINWQKPMKALNEDSLELEKNNNDFLEANKILFELEFSKQESNCDARTLDSNFIDNLKILDFETLTNLITGIEKISIKEEYNLKSMLSIFLNGYYTRSIQNSQDCEKIYNLIDSKINPSQNASYADMILKFNLVKDNLIFFSTKLDFEKDNKFFIKFTIKILSEIIRLKPMESLFLFSSLLERTENKQISNKNNSVNILKLKKKEIMLEWTPITAANCIFSMWSSKLISLIYQNILNNNSSKITKGILSNNNNKPDDLTNNKILLSIENAIQNSKDLLAKNNCTNNHQSSLLQKLQINQKQNNQINCLNNSNLIFKTSLLNILEFGYILERIMSLIRKYTDYLKESSAGTENLKWDFFEAESSKKNFKTKLVKESIKDVINSLNKFLKNEDVKIPIPNFSNFKKPISEILFVKSMSYLTADDIFWSMERPIKITLWSQEIIESNTIEGINKPEKYKFTYIMKKANDAIKEYKTSQIFLSIYNMLNFPQNKIEKDITENFKCYEIVAVGASIILIEFLQSTNPLKKKLSQAKSKFFLDHIELSLEINLLQKNSVTKEYIFKNHPRNLLLANFHEKFLDPIEWYRMRKAYAISFAVWSMCAYIVKLGDRHLDNVMLNEQNQVIFIDYGYVMNDGFNLPVPELMPIRFTNNLRYALGFLEESGVYFNTCFKVLKIIYKHSYVIFPQMKAILDNIRENAQLYDNVDYDLYPNWMSYEKLGSMSKKYWNNLETLVAFMKESKLKKDEDIQKVIRNCLQASADNAKLLLMYQGWSPHV